MCKKVKPTVKKHDYEFNDYYLLNDIDKDFNDDDSICDDDIDKVIKIQRFPVWVTKPNLIVEDDEYDRIELNNGWNLDINGPEIIVKGFSNINIKPEYKLIGYRYIAGGNGNGIVRAIPRNLRAPEVDECEMLKDCFLSPPKPKEALDDYMEAIIGDKSPFSYLQAAILNHELGEYGASWHGVGWGRDIILPLSQEKIEQFNKNKEMQYMWEMKEDEPAIIEPHFYYNDENDPVVVIYTINDIGEVTFNEYKHIFKKDNYTMKVERKVLGTAGEGIIF